MQRIGGRKFMMALFAIAAAILLEVYAPHGFTPTMAGFLVGIVTAFSAANYATTSKHFDSKVPAGEDNSGLYQEVSELKAMMQSSIGKPENMDSLLQVLTQIGKDTQSTRDTVGHLGKAVIGLSKR